MVGGADQIDVDRLELDRSADVDLVERRMASGIPVEVTWTPYHPGYRLALGSRLEVLDLVELCVRSRHDAFGPP
jgi:hypothetical protein